MAACTAALVETAMERRNGSGGDNEEVVVSPNEMFVVTLAALTSLQTSLENKQQQQQQQQQQNQEVQQQQEEVNAAIATELENTALPLLEILRRFLPYVAHFSNNQGALLSHQFGMLSRSLRLFVAMAYALPPPSALSGDSGKKGKRHQKGGNGGAAGGGGGGANALLRQILKTCTTLLLTSPSSVSEKDIGKLLHGTIIPMFHDARPKVRKAAWGCATEIVIVASSSSSSSSSLLDEGDDTVPETIIASHIQKKKMVADFLWEYCHAVITTTHSSKEDSTTKVIHVLRFLTSSLPYADDERIRIKFGEVCLKIMGGDTGGGEGKKKKKKTGEVSMEVVRELLLTLLSCLEQTEKEQEAFEQNDNATLVKEEELPKFAARALAFLLQHRPNMANSSYSSVGDVTVVYGRSLMACMERMMGLTRNNGIADMSGAVPASQLLAIKLLPNVLTYMLQLCDAPSGNSGGEGANTNDIAETCGSEFNQFVSRMMPIVMSYIVIDNDTLKGDGVKLQRLALEVIPSCIPIIQQALQIQYRNAWGSILSGGYVSFVSNLAMKKLELNEGSAVGGNDALSELGSKLQSWMKTLVSSLLRLHDDVEKDGIARTAVEYATSGLIRGMGLELFLSMVDFIGDDEENSKKKSSLSSTTTGGGIRDDRAWLVSLMKPSASTSSSLAVSSSLIPGTMLASSATTQTHLATFQGRVLNLARRCDAASADGHRTVAEASIQQSRVVEIWGLFPSFCVHPLDMKENFGALAKTVVKALGDHSRYPKIVVSTFESC